MLCTLDAPLFQGICCATVILNLWAFEKRCMNLNFFFLSCARCGHDGVRYFFCVQYSYQEDHEDMGETAKMTSFINHVRNQLALAEKKLSKVT